MSEHTIPLQIRVQDPKSRPVIERYEQFWPPTLLVLGPEGQVYYEWNGYLPSALYLAQLLLGQGKAALKQHRFEAAARLSDEVVIQYPAGDVAPEACYWAAVARYK